MKRLIASILISAMIIFGLPINAPVIRENIGERFAQMFTTPDASAAWVFRNFSGINKAAVFSTVPFSGVVPVDIKLVWFAETTTTEYSVGDTSVLLDGGTLSAAAAKYGTNGLSSTGEQFAALSISSYDIINTNKGLAGFWIKFNSLSSDNAIFFTFKRTDAYFKLRSNSDGSVGTVWSDTVNERYVNSASSVITTDVWYYIQVEWSSTDSDYIKVSINNNNVINSTLTIAPFDATDLQLGNSISVVNSLYFDSLLISDLSISRNFYTDTFNGTPYKDLTTSPR